MSISFGVSPIAWINDDMPELGGETPLATVFDDARDAGFAGIELGGKFPREPVALRALLDPYGLSLVGGWYSTELLVRTAEQEIEALQPHLNLLKAMGSKVFIAAETSNAVHSRRGVPLASTPRLDAGQWPQFGTRLSDLAEYIEGEGLRFAYHHHLGTVVERGEDVDAFLRHTGAHVGFTVDTGHAALGGFDAVDLIRQAPKRVAHVHCKDVRSDVFRRLIGEGGSFLDGVLAGMFTAPGDGSLDFGAVMQALRDIDYSGWVIVEAEQDPALADPRDYAFMGLETLKKAAETVGLVEAA